MTKDLDDKKPKVLGRPRKKQSSDLAEFKQFVADNASIANNENLKDKNQINEKIEQTSEQKALVLQKMNDLLDNLKKLVDDNARLEIPVWNKSNNPNVDIHLKEEYGQIRHRAWSMISWVVNRPMQTEIDYQEKNGGFLRFNPYRIKEMQKVSELPLSEFPANTLELRNRSLNLLSQVVELQKNKVNPENFDEYVPEQTDVNLKLIIQTNDIDEDQQFLFKF